MKHLPSIKQLQYLVALADQGSFSNAAASCNITQPTLSAGIAALETLLEQQLVDRSHKNVILTPIGEEIVVKARNILSEATIIVERAHYAKDPLSGPLRIGIIPTIAPYLLPKIIPSLQEKFPKLELQIHEDLSENIVSDLKNCNLDLLIMALPYDVSNIESETLIEEDFVLATPKGYWQKKTPARTNDLKGENLMLLEEGHCLRDHALDACKYLPSVEKQAFGATSLTTLIHMVQYGYGITLLPQMAASESMLPDQIDLVPFADSVSGREISLIWREESPRAEAYREIGNAIKSII